VDEVIIYCVNDNAVMTAWAKDQGVGTQEGSLITMMADPYGQLTNALGTQLTHPGPQGKGLVGRTKRFAAYLESGVVKYFSISENANGAEDPAGDDFPESSCAPAMMEAIANLRPALKGEL
jgi:peroxiredoxin